MTTRQYQLIAIFAAAFCAVCLVAGILTKTRAERDAVAATHYIDSVSAQLDTARLYLADAEALARAGLVRSAAYQVTIDSIWRLAIARRDSLHRRTPVVVDVRDTLAVVAELAALTKDVAEARAETAFWVETAADLKTAAALHARDDSVRFADIAASVARADTSVTHAAEDAATARVKIRPRWWARLGRGIVTGVKVGGIATLAFLAGRAS